MKPVSEMTMAELEAEAATLAALRTPATLGLHLDPRRFRMRAHTRVIGDALAALGRDYDRLLLITPPQIGKSTLAAVWTPFWWLTQDASLRTIIASYAAGLATRHTRDVRGLVQAHGADYGVELRRDTTAADEWYTSAGGGLKAVGLGSGVTGFPAGRMVVDDPHADRQAANSPTQREAVWDWWSGSLISRLAPDVPVAVVQTAWHPDDLRGRLLKREGRLEEGGAWKVVHLPAFADLELTRGTDPMGRQPGEPISHPLLADGDVGALRRHWDGKKSRSSAQDWSAMYQGDPQPKGGALLTSQMIDARTHTTGLPPAMKSAVCVDPSGGGRDACGIVGGYLGTDKRCYVTHDWTAVMPSTDWPRAACRMAVEIDADRITLEKNYGGDQVLTLVRTAWIALRREWDDDNADAIRNGLIDQAANPYRRIAPRITYVHAKKSKLLRADPIAGQIIEDRYRFAGVFTDLTTQWTTWQPSDPTSPGNLDAAVYLGYELLPVPQAQEVIGREADRPVRQEDVRPTGWAARRID